MLVSAQAADIYVSPTGSDLSPGTKARPMASLERARGEARQRRAQSPAETITVWLFPGDYFLDRGLELSQADSGRPGAPTIYRSLEGRSARLLNARKVKATDFRRIGDQATLARIPAELRGKILQLDLSELGVRHGRAYPDVFDDSGGLVSLYFAGSRMPLARYPNEGYATIRRILDTGGGLQDRNYPKPTNVKPASRDSGGTFEYREDAYAHFER